MKSYARFSLRWEFDEAGIALVCAAKLGKWKMDWTFTLALLAAGIVLTVFYSVRGARRKDPLSVPLIPPTALLFLGVLLILLAGSHALTLMGIEHNRAQLRP